MPNLGPVALRAILEEYIENELEERPASELRSVDRAADELRAFIDARCEEDEEREAA